MRRSSQWRSPLMAVPLALVLLLTLVFTASPARTVQADSSGISPGCAFINQNSSSDQLDLPGLQLNAGEVITVTITSGDNYFLEIYNYDTGSFLVGNETDRVTPPYSLSWTVTATQVWKLFLGVTGNETPSTGSITCTLPSSIVLQPQRTITVWGAVGIRAVVWQWQDSQGHWWWFLQGDNSSRIETPIEYRDRTRDGKVIPHYALSRITTTSADTQNDPKAYRAFNADTLAPLHQVWIEIGSEADPSRLSVFVP